MDFKKLTNITGWIVFAIALIVYIMSAERTGSLWDCGEFITGAHKLQVVHPPGAALFLLIGRMFTMVADTISSDPAMIAFSVNLLSGICGAFTALFICWVTIMMGKLAIVGRKEEPDSGQQMALMGAGTIAGLSTAFSTSIWFSAVEGEVYAMSTFFTALTLWSMVKWYYLPDSKQTDKWLIFTVYAAGLSTGVHLLSLLTFPALALFYYFKKYENHNLLGMAAAAGTGVAFIVGIQYFIITGIPRLWATLELFMVNGLGMPFHSSVIPLLLIIIGIFYFGLRYAHKNRNAILQQVLIAAMLVVVAFSTVGVIMIRANANTPINMNSPTDPMRLLPYLNREQYGERALLNGPDFDVKREDIIQTKEDRYGRVAGEDKYKIVDRKIHQDFKSRAKHFLPRMQDGTQGRPRLYKIWMETWGSKGSPTFMDNMKFMVKYQIGWMYGRYFMWNFAGRQNGDQGIYSWDPTDGNWLSGISFLDSGRLYDQSYLPDRIANNKARNTYFLLPFLFGLLGFFFHFSKNKNDGLALLALFIITGIGIIIYSNQPPREPRERDYVLVGSFFTFCIWIGMGGLALFEILKTRANLSSNIAAPVGIGLVMLAPLVMGFQNFDDHSRAHHSGARDYAHNFLESCEPNSIIFTYGDNDTYPLWYAQEVENIRTDVRVVNLSLIAVDWYIDQLRRKVNDSPAIKMSCDSKQIRGYKRNQLVVQQNPSPMPLSQAIRTMCENHPEATRGQLESYCPGNIFTIPVNKQKAIANGTVSREDADKMVDRIVFDINDIYRDENEQRAQQKAAPRTNGQLLKGDFAVLDIVNSNFLDRPIYWAVTCRPESLLGLDDYLQLEGLGLKLVPLKNRQREYGNLGLMGKGKVNIDKTKDVMLNKFKWGGFDQKELFVDRSYGPAIQSQKAAFVRTAQEMLKQGRKQEAIEMGDKFFTAFPHMNFRYEFQSMYMMDVYVEAGGYEKAKVQMELLATETEQYLQFLYGLDDYTRTSEYGFRREFTIANTAKDYLVNLANKGGDSTYSQQLKDRFAPYQTTPVRD